MAENNQNKFDQQDKDWDQNRQQQQNREQQQGQQGNYGQVGYGDTYNSGGRSQYDNPAFGNRGYGQSGYDQSSFGQGYDQSRQEDRYRNASSGYGQQGRQQYGQAGSDYRQSGSEVFGSTGQSGQQQSNQYYGSSNFGQGRSEDEWSRRQESNYGQTGQNRGGYGGGYGSYGQTGNAAYGGSYRPGNQHESYGNRPGYQPGREEDRSWWERTKDQVSSWFDADDNNRGRSDNRQRLGGGHRGKGPKEYQRSAERIREDIYDRLSDDDHIDATHVSVQVTGNEVVLTGTVNSREEKRHAEDLVEAVSGVRHVENRIRVGSSSDQSSLYQAASQSTVGRTDLLSDHEYTGTTDNPGGIGNESGTTNEIIRNAKREQNK